MPTRWMICLAICSWATKSYPAEDAEFEAFQREYQAQFAEFADDRMAEFEAFVERWHKAEREYQTELQSHWAGDVRLPDRQHWVEYSDDNSERTIIDYDDQVIEFEFTAVGSEAEAVAKAKAKLEELSHKTVRQAVNRDPVHIKAGISMTASESFRNGDRPLLAAQIVKRIDVKSVAPQKSRGRTKVTVGLPKEHQLGNAADFVGVARKHAAEWQVSPALVMAVIHTESSFNPLARSHIPAFGLMQIVPKTAGKDVTEFLSGQQYLLTPDQLYDAETNIQAGSVYLHLLSERYFRHVTNLKSRHIMTIAAYNTGPGNVARALSGQTTLSAAARAANSMTPAQVYQKLQQDLPAEETKQYLKKVIDRQTHYTKQLEL